MESGTSWLLAATGFAVAMSGTPGPNNAMVAASGANFGLRRSLPHMLGITLGFPTMLLAEAVALGAGEALRAAPGLHLALRWVGAAWLLLLAWRIATAAPDAPGGPGRGTPMSFLAAAAFQYVNPKAWVIALAAYTTPGAALLQAAVLAGIFALVTMPILLGWALLGVASARMLRGTALRWFNRGMAALLMLSLLPLLRG